MHVMFSDPEVVPHGTSEVICRGGSSRHFQTAQVTGREPEGFPEGKSDKIVFGSQRGSNLDFEDGSNKRCSRSLPPGQSKEYRQIY